MPVPCVSSGCIGSEPRGKVVNAHRVIHSVEAAHFNLRRRICPENPSFARLACRAKNPDTLCTCKAQCRFESICHGFAYDTSALPQSRAIKATP
jgi:hypothetical protein